MWTIRSTPAAAAARKRRADAAIAHSNVDPPRGNLIQNVLWSTSMPVERAHERGLVVEAERGDLDAAGERVPGRQRGERTSVRTERSRARSSRAIAEPV